MVVLLTVNPALSLLLFRGQARNFTSIRWYHFPKSGGTTLRKRVYIMCQKEGFNMTSNYANYGMKDECKTMSFSCTKGNKVYIAYGHKNEEAEFLTPGTLNIIMLRKPLSWLLSRIQLADRQSKNVSSLINAIHKFTPKYFMYTDSKTNRLLMDWYEKIRKDVSSSETNGTTSFVSTHQLLAVSRSLHDLLQKNTLVLVTEQYARSMRLLSYIFDTNYLIPETSIDILNRAFDRQQDVSVGSYAEMKTLSSLLTPHDLFYYAAYEEFLRELEYAKLF